MTPADGAVDALYIHVPYCARKCPYCDFNSIAGRDDEHQLYVDAVLQELRALPRGPYASVFMGGGTPTHLERPALERLLAGIAAHVALAADYEWTCEANPGSSDAATFALLAAHGVNRLSIGVQSIHDHHLQWLGRIHTAAEAERVVAAAVEIMPRVSADLIVGLPNQTFAELEAELDFYRRHALRHASVYHLAIEPGTEFAAQYARGDLSLPDDVHAERVLIHVGDQLESLGLERYETSNFAAAGQACRHNLAYWRQRDYHAVGAGAVSTLAGVRITREPHPGRYIAAMNAQGEATWKREVLSGQDLLIEAWMLGLRLAEGVSEARLAELGDVVARWEAVAAGFVADGLLERDAGWLRLTSAGRRLQDSITVALMPAVADDT